MRVRLKELKESDLPFIKEIYDYYTLNTTVVYFITPVSVEQIRTFFPIGDPVYRSFIIESAAGEAVGFCYFSKFKPREAFRISVEVTIYLKPEAAGKGYGNEALGLLEEVIASAGFHNMIAVVGSENTTSAHLFEKAGYTCCADIKEVGEKFGRKIGLKMFQKILNN